MRVPLLISLALLAGCGDTVSMRQAKRDIANTMKDPDAALFRTVVKFETGAVCGEVNGKNSYGAYTGYVPFIWMPATGAQEAIARIEPPRSTAVLGSVENLNDVIRSSEFTDLRLGLCTNQPLPRVAAQLKAAATVNDSNREADAALRDADRALNEARAIQQ